MELDRRSDVYVLGVMAYQMLTGQLPFTAAAIERLTAPPRPFERTAPAVNIPSHAEAACMSALSKNREERPPSASAFHEQLSGWLHGAREQSERALIERVQEASDHHAMRLIYADWLEERGCTTQSEFLRAQVELMRSSPSDARFATAGARLRELALSVDLEWRRAVALAPIEGCDDMRFDFVCPKTWQALTPIAGTGRSRFCDSCRRRVHYCNDIADAQRLATAGECVVLDTTVTRSPGDIDPTPTPFAGRPPGELPTMGAPVPPGKPQKVRGWLARLLKR
jgi:uncharacterized protein (TIGR02996 family)